MKVGFRVVYAKLKLKKYSMFSFTLETARLTCTTKLPHNVLMDSGMLDHQF